MRRDVQELLKHPYGSDAAVTALTERIDSEYLHLIDIQQKDPSIRIAQTDGYLLVHPQGIAQQTFDDIPEQEATITPHLTYTFAADVYRDGSSDGFLSLCYPSNISRPQTEINLLSRILDLKPDEELDADKDTQIVNWFQEAKSGRNCLELYCAQFAITSWYMQTKKP